VPFNRLIGYAASMPKDVRLTLYAEMLALEQLLAYCAETFHLVGYSTAVSILNKLGK
jgi:hypothetical protein